MTPGAMPGAPDRPPDLLRAALICLDDGCPPEDCMQLCRLQEDYSDGICSGCWSTYLYWVNDHRRGDPYHDERLREIG